MLQIQSCTHEIWPFSLEIDDFILRQCLIKLKNLDLLGHRLLTGHEIDSEVVKRKAAFLVRCEYKPIFSCWSVWPCWHFLIDLHWEWMSLQMPRHKPQLDYWGWFDVEVAMSTGVNALTEVRNVCRLSLLESQGIFHSCISRLVFLPGPLALCVSFLLMVHSPDPPPPPPPPEKSQTFFKS